MFKKILFIFTVISFIEILMLLILGSYLGVLVTICLTILTAAAGIYILKKIGLGILTAFIPNISNNDQEKKEKLSLLIGGILLIIPGFITDITGILLLVPSLRKIILGYITAKKNSPHKRNHIK